MNGRIVHVHYSEVVPHRPETIMFSVASARRHLLMQALFVMNQHIQGPHIFNMDQYFECLRHLQFILRVTAETDEPDEIHFLFTGNHDW